MIACFSEAVRRDSMSSFDLTKTPRWSEIGCCERYQD